MKKLNIKSQIKDYEVFFEEDFLFFSKFKTIRNKAVIIDQNVYKFYSELIDETFEKDEIFLIEAIEENKSIRMLEEIYDWLTLRNAKRNLTLISIGGGITQDLTGFVASTLYRGIKWLFVPTTLLAQTDSCIGSKTSLNYKSFKNLLGTFYPPDELYITSLFHDTLQQRDIHSGLGEIIKFQIMEETYPKDLKKCIDVIEKCKEDKNFLLNQIYKNLDIKRSYMKGDEFDMGRRNLLNYGHCFGHALETASNYHIPHGIAVNIGIIFANLVALGRNLISKDNFNLISEKMNLPNIFMDIREKDFDENNLLKSIKNDKKRVGKELVVVLPVNNDFVLEKVTDLTEDEFKKTLVKLKNIIIK